MRCTPRKAPRLPPSPQPFGGHEAALRPHCRAPPPTHLQVPAGSDHTRIVPSMPTLQATAPLAEIATDNTGFSWPAMTALQSPVAVSHRHICRAEVWGQGSGGRGSVVLCTEAAHNYVKTV